MRTLFSQISNRNRFIYPGPFHIGKFSSWRGTRRPRRRTQGRRRPRGKRSSWKILNSSTTSRPTSAAIILQTSTKWLRSSRGSARSLLMPWPTQSMLIHKRPLQNLRLIALVSIKLLRHPWNLFECSALIWISFKTSDLWLAKWK